MLNIRYTKEGHYTSGVLKLPTEDNMSNSCLEALNQIRDKHYDTYLRNKGRNDILIYGIAFYKKRCKVVVEKL